MRNLWIRLLPVVLCLALLSGCGTTFLNPEAEIKAPGAVGLYGGVQEALETAVGQDIILKYPTVNGKHTAFYPVDLDGDGTQEILAFYQQRTEGAVTRVHLIGYQDDGWRSVQDLEPVGGDVADVDFCDLDGDGRSEVCVGWTVYTARGNQMCVYQMENGVLVQRAVEAYTRYVVCDIDGDGIQDLGLALLDADKQTSTLSFYRMKEEALTGIGAIVLDGSVSAYAKITAAGVTGNTVGVYLDAYKGNNVMVTELVYWKDGRLYNPFAAAKGTANTHTLRYYPLTSADVNADGVLEIPFMERLPGYEPEDEDSLHHLVCWRYFNGTISDRIGMWWYNAAQRYYLELDGRWQDAVTVVADETDGSYGFYQWNGSAVGRELFRLKTFSASDWLKLKDTPYTVLYETESTVWAAAVQGGNAYEITPQQLQKQFHLIIE